MLNEKCNVQIANICHYRKVTQEINDIGSDLNIQAVDLFKIVVY